MTTSAGSITPAPISIVNGNSVGTPSRYENVTVSVAVGASSVRTRGRVILRVGSPPIDNSTTTESPT